MRKRSVLELPKNTFGLFVSGAPQHKPILAILGFKARDLAAATDIPIASVRYDSKMPRALFTQLREIGTIINAVGEFFNGDKGKTSLWFQVPNPMLGGISPSDMIRCGRISKLYKVVDAALSENK